MSQEFPDDSPAPSRDDQHGPHLSDRMLKVEAMVQELMSRIRSNPPDSPSSSCRSTTNTASLTADISPLVTDGVSAHAALPTPLSPSNQDPHTRCRTPGNNTASPPSALRISSATAEVSAEPDRLQALSQALLDSLPPQTDIQLLCRASARNPTLFNAHLTKSYSTLERLGLNAADGILSHAPAPTAHPVLIAIYMLQLAILLQDMHQEVHPELKLLSESPPSIMERSANAAIKLVTTQDELLGSIESLECVILESVYRCNHGNLRQSWMAARRAILLAQIMGLHLNGRSRRQSLQVLDPHTTSVEPQHLWFRIVSYDLVLCRMLGLPPGAADSTPSSFHTVSDTVLGSLERTHCDIMAQVLKRKLSQGPPDFETTHRLDQELQRAAKGVSNSWWLAPNLNESSKDPTTLFWDMRRLIVQMLHHDLLNQLHIPYMLGQGRDRTVANWQRSDLSRLVCVNSSREVLSRLVLLRNFNQFAFSCRIGDFLGLMAAITLVLAHLGDHSHRRDDDRSSQVDSVLSHQAPSDRALMERALENMRQMSRLSGDALSAQSADVLRRLLDIESRNDDHSAGGDDHRPVTREHVIVQTQSDDPNNNNLRSLHDGGGGVSPTTENMERVHIPYFGVIKIVRENVGSRVMSTTVTRPEGEARHAREVAEDLGEPLYGQDDLSGQPWLPGLIDPLLPGLNNAAEHWSLQGIDMTFLDSFLSDQWPDEGVGHGSAG